MSASSSSIKYRSFPQSLSQASIENDDDSFGTCPNTTEDSTVKIPMTLRNNSGNLSFAGSPTNDIYYQNRRSYDDDDDEFSASDPLLTLSSLSAKGISRRKNQTIFRRALAEINIKNIAVHFIQVALFLAIVITFLLVLKLKGVYPSHDLTAERPDKVWYTSKFHHIIPDTLEPNIALWNTPDTLEKDQFTEKSETNNISTIRAIAEFHSHTNYSDGAMSPEQLVDWAVAYGFHVLFVTDHNTLEGGLKAREYAQRERASEILIIPGVEYTCCRIHMNLVGISETIKPNTSKPTDEDLKWAIDETHRQGGLVFVNHLPWSLSTEWNRQVPTLLGHPSIQQLIEWGVDGFESVSEGVLDLPTIRVTEKYGFPYITATDIHHPSVVPTAWTVLNLEQKRLADRFPEINWNTFDEVVSPVGWITNQTNDRTINETQTILTIEVLNLLRSRQKDSTNFYYSPIGPHERVYPVRNSARDWFIPLESIDLTYFWTESRGMYSFVSGFCHEKKFELHFTRIFAFLAWSILAFVLFEAIEIVLIKPIRMAYIFKKP